MSQGYIGKTCPYCQYPIKQDSEVVVCAECHIPHHRGCWQENGGCTTFGHQGLREEARQVPAASETRLTHNQPQISTEDHDRTYTTLVDLQCPVEVVSVKIDASRDQEKASAAIRFRNLSEKSIIALKLKIFCFDVFGESVIVEGENYFEKKLQDLTALKGAEFGDEASFELKGFTDTRKLNIQVYIVLFEDQTRWDYGGSPVYEVKVTPLKGPGLKDLQTVAGAKAVCYARKEEAYWQCVCGRANLLTAVNCLRCGYQMAEAFKKASGAETVAEALKQIKDHRVPILTIDIDIPVQEVQHYTIDYQHGTIALGNLQIGARVVDPSWSWEFKTGDNYTGSGEKKSVTWLVVAKDYYGIKEPHVTLLAEELIGRHLFDNSKSWLGLVSFKNHWGDSGTGYATCGLRPWLNSSGIHSGEGFYQAFSNRFKQAVLTTPVPNREWKNGSGYSTQDRIFIPSTTEMGDAAHFYTYQIGTIYPCFEGQDNAKRVARIGRETRCYWTRSPASSFGDYVRYVYYAGEFVNSLASKDYGAVRPALNLKSEILVSEINH